MKTTREQLERQALLFFAINDFERSSLDDIARAMNVTKGAIYHYFKGKDDLFRSAVLRLLDNMDEMLTIFLPGDLPFKDALFSLFLKEDIMKEIPDSIGMESALGDYKNILYLFMASLKKFPELKTRMDSLYMNFRERLINQMNAGIVRGELRRDIDTEAIAYEITAFYEGALLLGAFSDHEKDIKELGPRVCASIWERIGNK